MGKGAFVKIKNGTDEALSVSYSNIVGVYQNGEQGSNFGPITGQLNPHGRLPAAAPRQYIEAISSPYQSSFDMVFTHAGYSESVVLKFSENYHEWWADNPFMKFEKESLQFTAKVTQDGDQYDINVSVQYTINPENWMESVYDKIHGTKLCMLPIPGSHDAITYPDVEPRSQTQSKSIKGQLLAGFRYFDFRVKVNNGVYYGYHGADNTEHDYTSVDPNVGNKPFILDDIVNFLKTHEKEVVILNFSHFTGNSPQDFNTGDARNFVKLVQAHFAGMLVPRAKKPTVTYGDCVDNKQQVVVIISDSASKSDKALAEAWYEYPANTPQGQAERQNSLFWMSSDCWLDRYSDIRYGLGVDLHSKVVKTLKDQEEYLKAPQPGEVGHRDPDKFWVTQAVLNYDAVSYEGHSLNYWGSRVMNPLSTYIYENDWRHGHTHNWDNQGTTPILAPNILLLDFSGNFDGFPEACVRMLK